MANQREPRRRVDIERRQSDDRRDHRARQELLSLYVRIYLRCLTDDTDTAPREEELTFSEHTQTATALASVDRLTQSRRTIAEFVAGMVNQGYQCEWDDGQLVGTDDLENWLAS